MPIALPLLPDDDMGPLDFIGSIPEPCHPEIPHRLSRVLLLHKDIHAVLPRANHRQVHLPSERHDELQVLRILLQTHDIVNIREFPVRQKAGEIKIRVVMDRYSMELFVNDGEQAASFVLYTPQEANAVSFSSDGSVLVDVEKYDLEIR